MHYFHTELLPKLNQLLLNGKNYFDQATEAEISAKPSPEKWSKKEILGHLIDSGINNLQRFTEIQYSEKPYLIRKYNQDALVMANDYQHADIGEILNFWLAINHRIMQVIKLQTTDSLSFEIQLPDGEIADLRFLMIDYVEHLEHHLTQLSKK